MYINVEKNKSQIKFFINQLKKIDDSRFRIINRNIEKEKDPYKFLSKLEYDIDDMIYEIKMLNYYDYLRCQIDSKNEFLLMYSFIKVIKKYIVFIKLSLVERENEIVYVISFHEALKDELNARPFKEEKR